MLFRLVHQDQGLTDDNAAVAEFSQEREPSGGAGLVSPRKREKVAAFVKVVSRIVESCAHGRRVARLARFFRGGRIRADFIG